jgi:heat shock protein HslJ
VLLSLVLLPQAAFAAQVPVQLPPAPASAGPSLTQGVWLWTRTEYNDDSVLRSPDPNAYTLAFMSDGRLAIRADCNTGSATYTVDGSSLTIQPGVMTLAACPPGSQDGPFLRDLAQVVTYVFNGPQLVLNIKLDTGNMIFSPQSLTGLSGPTWRVTSYNNGMNGVVSVVPGTQLSMVFGDDGQVSGNTGCNQFSGTYTISGASIAFGPIATTLRACLSDAANLQEQQFLSALNASTTYELTGDRLTFRSDDGATQIIALRPTVSPVP